MPSGNWEFDAMPSGEGASGVWDKILMGDNAFLMNQFLNSRRSGQGGSGGGGDLGQLWDWFSGGSGSGGGNMTTYGWDFLPDVAQSTGEITQGGGFWSNLFGNQGTKDWIDLGLNIFGGALSGHQATDIANQPSYINQQRTPWNNYDIGQWIDALTGAATDPDRFATQENIMGGIMDFIGGGQSQQQPFIEGYNPSMFDAGAMFEGSPELRDAIMNPAGMSTLLGLISGGGGGGGGWKTPRDQAFLDSLAGLKIERDPFVQNLLKDDYLMSNVDNTFLDEIHRRGIEDLEERMLPGLSGAAVRAGAGGSHGMKALQAALLEEGALDNIAGQQAQVQMQIYEANKNRQVSMQQALEQADAALRGQHVGYEGNRLSAEASKFGAAKMAGAQRYSSAVQGALGLMGMQQGGAQYLYGSDQRSDEFAKTMGFNSWREYEDMMMRQNYNDRNYGMQYGQQGHNFGQDFFGNLMQAFGAGQQFDMRNVANMGGMMQLLLPWLSGFGNFEQISQGPQGNPWLSALMGGIGGATGGIPFFGGYDTPNTGQG